MVSAIEAFQLMDQGEVRLRRLQEEPGLLFKKKKISFWHAMLASLIGTILS